MINHRALIDECLRGLHESVAKNEKPSGAMPSQITCSHESWHVYFGIPSCANCGLLQSQIDDAQLVRARHPGKSLGVPLLEDVVEPPVEALPDDYYAQLAGAA